MYDGGAGGGEVLLNDNGPTAQAGNSSVGGFGGPGFGACGGAGGRHCISPFPCYAGGKGNDGLVYIE